MNKIPKTPVKMKLKVGDEVMMRRGKQRGQTGKIVQVLPLDNKVVVDGINIVKKHRKPTQANPQGGIEELTKPVWASSVAIVHPTDKTKTSRIGFSTNKSGDKVRIYKQAGGKEIK
ncbi:50S ribosomal protein L24 [Candidatus Saccharibacteria bacterium]|jgi:large subunit ribosomal protein L24|nr:50S ribosomal protein L24 [Candidatus Saccharibacteria bacterium]